MRNASGSGPNANSRPAPSGIAPAGPSSVPGAGAWGWRRHAVGSPGVTGAVTGRSPRPSPGIERRDLRVDVDPPRPGVGVLAHALEAHLAAVAGLADAAERRSRVDALVAVDPDHAAADRP